MSASCIIQVKSTEVRKVYRLWASSLMLTGETAAGQYPVQAMEYLVRTARTAM